VKSVGDNPELCDSSLLKAKKLRDYYETALFASRYHNAFRSVSSVSDEILDEDFLSRE